ncbi:MAG: glycosyltransferase family 2 protein [Spirochaetes bacterium]|nr:MAG: glycosyltransferase family 2 protein [Spirochaetota bacterium]
MARKARTKLIVIVPAYNEAERIEATIKALKTVRAPFAKMGVDHLVYVIDDGSSDDTGKLAQAAGADKVVRHKINRGLGAAIRTGLGSARKDGADIVVKFDADLQHDPNDIFPMIQPIQDDEADVVYGNRFEKIAYKMPFVRRIGNIMFTGLMRFLTGWPLKDSQPGIFAVNKDYLENFYLPGNYNYTQQVLLDAYHRGLRFAHVSVSFQRRITGKSFVSLKYPFKVSRQILMVLVSVEPMKIFGSIGLLFLAPAFLLFATELALYFMGLDDKPVVHVNLLLGLSVFGLQTFFFGLIAELIVKTRKQ